MLFQPAIIALLLAAALALGMLTLAAPFAWQVMRHWDLQSGSEQQLVLERRTYLFSTLVNFVLLCQLAALLLFVFTADHLADMFVGAMCAVGTLNVNGYGFPALFTQMAVFFLAAVWLVINHLDNLARDYPLVRIKYGLLLGLLPVVALSFGLQLRYFSGLEANVITSCCGSLFSDSGKTLVSEATALAPRPAMLWLALAMSACGLSAWAYLRKPAPAAGLAVALSGAAGFVAALVAVLSFVSLYIYEHPHHHCPFCLLKPEYHYQGYALYLPLFTATAASLAVGALQAFAHRPSLRLLIPPLAIRLTRVAAWGFALFSLLVGVVVLLSNLRLLEE